MRLALLCGNRFNPWHFRAFKRLRGDPSVTAFRVESEVQRRFDACDDGSAQFDVEPVYFDTQAGNPLVRLKNVIGERYLGREPRVLPFYERLQGYDVIQSWELFTDWSAQAVLVRRGYDVPLSVMVWDNIPFNMEQRPYRREIKRQVAAHADRFLVYTERSRRMLDIEGVPSERVVRLNPGVDTDLFAPGPSRRNEFGLSDDEFIILFVGWLLPRKGIDYLVLALHELLRDPSLKQHRFRLAVVGGDVGRKRVEALLARLDIAQACEFLGTFPYNRMPAVYRAANAFVLPSIATPEWQEQFGMSLLEAMACGKPVIGTYSGAIPEIVGDAGLLCPPNDSLSLYDALKRLVQDPAHAKALGVAARARVLQQFTLEQQARGLSDVYESLV